MNKTRKISLNFAIFVLLFISAGAAHACSCIYGTEGVREWADKQNVAILKVVSLDRSGPAGPSHQVDGVRRVKLRVERVFKGAIKKGEDLTFTQGGGGDCIWYFKDADVGRSYLFYLDAPLPGGPWGASICSGSAPVEEVPADIAYLGKLDKVLGKTRISGRVVEHVPMADGKKIIKPVSGVSIIIKGAGLTVKAKTTANGVYEIYGLPPGFYTIVPKNKEDFLLQDASSDDPVKLEAGGHAGRDFNKR